MALTVTLNANDLTPLLRDRTLRIITTAGDRPGRCDLSLNMAPDYSLGGTLEVTDGATTYFSGTTQATATIELAPGSPVTDYTALDAAPVPAGGMAPFALTDKSAELSWNQVTAAILPYCHWRLGESTGTNAIDEQSVQNGTYVNAPTLGVDGAMNTGNTAVTFNGTDEYMTVGAAHLRGRVGVSIAAWVKSSASAANQIIYAERSTAGAALIRFYLDTSGRPTFQWRNDAGTIDTIVPSSGDWTDGAWHHVSVTKYGTAVAIYVDGYTRATATLTATDTQTSTMTANIGRDPYTGDQFFDGTLDEVMIFRYQLAAEEAQMLYASADFHRYLSLRTENTWDGIGDEVFNGTVVTLDAGLLPGQRLGVVSENHNLVATYPIAEITLTWLNATTPRWEVVFGNAPIKLAAAFP